MSGLQGGVSGEFLLELVDLVSDLGRFQGGLVGGQVGLLGGVEDAGGEESVVGRGRLVVDPCASADGVGGVADGFLGRGEEVEPVVDQGPELVEQVELGRGVVAVVKAVAADEMVVLGLDGGLVVLLVGPRSGEVDVTVGGPADQVVVDEL